MRKWFRSWKKGERRIERQFAGVRNIQKESAGPKSLQVIRQTDVGFVFVRLLEKKKAWVFFFSGALLKSSGKENSNGNQVSSSFVMAH